jgi:hypothetical protein
MVRLARHGECLNEAASDEIVEVNVEGAFVEGAHQGGQFFAGMSIYWVTATRRGA